jgi:hypothetical protein
MRVGIVGSQEAKFTQLGKERALQLIWEILAPDAALLVSGHCHLGGIDIWAEEIADDAGLEKLIFPPKELSWEKGYKPRNLQIARASDIVHCITVKQLPEGFKGPRFLYCYHCRTEGHVKNGGCWTMHRAIALGKQGHLHVIENY